MRNPFLMIDPDHGNPPAELRKAFNIIRHLPAGTHARCACGMYAVTIKWGGIIFYRLRDDPGHICSSLSVYYDNEGEQ